MIKKKIVAAPHMVRIPNADARLVLVFTTVGAFKDDYNRAVVG